MSSEKRKFIQGTSALFVAAHHRQPDADKAIDWAEALWGKLISRGYGTAQGEKKPRASIDHYKQLSENTQKWFCLFWKNYHYPHARNDAAKAWGQLGDLPDTEYTRICDAAKQEADRQLPQGQSRKLAAGWLREMRFNDKADPAKKNIKKADPAIIEIQQALTHARRMYEQTKLDDWNNEVIKLQDRLSALTGRQHG